MVLQALKNDFYTAHREALSAAIREGVTAERNGGAYNRFTRVRGEAIMALPFRRAWHDHSRSCRLTLTEHPD
jgi:hypothetical protein